jgi:uncharacterized protein YjbI with pentapeptide repeats
LRNANLSGVNLSGVNLSGADLSGVNLSGVNLSGADLSGADLSDANLSGVNLSGVNLRGVNLRNADLSGASLCGASLRSADLRNADLSGVRYNENTAFFALQCPEEGSFIAYKKCAHNTIVKLCIPENAKRSSATSRKCRAEFAEVLEIQNIDGTIYGTEVKSQRDNTLYKVGEMVYPNSFDENRWNECSTGIHFFITRQEAVQF